MHFSWDSCQISSYNSSQEFCSDSSQTFPGNSSIIPLRILHGISSSIILRISPRIHPGILSEVRPGIYKGISPEILWEFILHSFRDSTRDYFWRSGVWINRSYIGITSIIRPIQIESQISLTSHGIPSRMFPGISSEIHSFLSGFVLVHSPGFLPRFLLWFLSGFFPGSLHWSFLDFLGIYPGISSGILTGFCGSFSEIPLRIPHGIFSEISPEICSGIFSGTLRGSFINSSRYLFRVCFLILGQFPRLHQAFLKASLCIFLWNSFREIFRASLSDFFFFGNYA